MRVNIKMAVPRGDRRRNLNTGFIEFAAPEAFQDAQVRLNMKLYQYLWPEAVVMAGRTR